MYEKIDFSAQIIGIVGVGGLARQHSCTSMPRLANINLLRYSTALVTIPLSSTLTSTTLQTFYTHGGKLLLLDELHKVKNFSAHIKAIYDFTDLQVLFSGSSAMNIKHEIGDLLDEKIVLEVGGKSKDAKKIAGVDHAYLAIDDLESGYDHTIPLWLFGFLY